MTEKKTFMFRAHTKFQKHFERATSEKQARVQAAIKGVKVYSLLQVL